MPSGGFDVLPDSFNKLQLILTILGLTAGVVITKVHRCGSDFLTYALALTRPLPLCPPPPLQPIVDKRKLRAKWY